MSLRRQGPVVYRTLGPCLRRGTCKQRGNALFLILIAVALFAALTYAITQSARSGGNDISREGSIVSAGQLTEMPAAVRQAVERLMITGASASSITFTGAATSSDVFAPGTGTVNFPPPPGACSPGCTAWVYQNFTDTTHGLFVGGVGTDAPEILAVLPAMTLSVCTQMQKGLGFASSIPPAQDTTAFDWTTITSPISAAGGLKGSASTIWSATLTGQEFACVNNLSSTYFYYHVLLTQ